MPNLRDVAMTSATSAFAVGWNLFLSRWDVIAIASVVIVIGYLVRMRLWASN